MATLKANGFEVARYERERNVDITDVTTVRDTFVVLVKPSRRAGGDVAVSILVSTATPQYFGGTARSGYRHWRRSPYRMPRAEVGAFLLQIDGYLLRRYGCTVTVAPQSGADMRGCPVDIVFPSTSDSEV